MIVKRLILVLAATSALAVAGCGSSGGNSSSGPATSATSATAAATPATSGGAVKVSMKNIAFNPKSVTVKVGDKVTWTNDDSVDHNVTAASGADFKSDNFGQGGTFAYTPTKAGTIQYTCTIHPGMNGTVIVQ
ncbi:MAG: blue (type 1) copper domain protein [Solirubrobacterales bacterium]|nr:blue (type 1) copper domain protein [Solirubrobacterales bacterium]